MIKRGMSFEFADTGTNAGQTGFDPPKQFKLPFKMKKVSGGDVDDIETGDVTRIMPRLRQIHKLGYTLQGHKDFQGLRIAIENRRGSVRKGTDSDGNEWRTKMKHPYGYIVGTRGADGEPVDTYVGPKEDAPAAFVVHQHKDTGKGYDEDKVMLGFRNKREAKEAYLEHYDDPKFLGPISRVSMDRFRQLVASKRQLVKISHASWMGMLDELQSIGGLEKVAFGPQAAKKVLRLAKKKIVKVPRMEQTGQRAMGQVMRGEQPKLTFSEAALMQGGGAPMAVHPSAAKKIKSMASSGAISGPMTSPEMVSGAKQMQGRIITARGGDATKRVREHPLVGDAVAGPISRMTPDQRMMHNAVIKRHELAELGIKAPTSGGAQAFSLGTGHMGAAAPLTDHTVLATLPKGSAPIREAVQGYRGVEADLLERATRGVGGRPGIEFGAKGTRLSRHARKRIGGRMEQMAGQDLQKALSDPEMGPAVKQQLKALGINEIAGIGKLAKAPQRVVDRERKRLVRKAGPAVGALLGAGVGAARGARKGKLLSNVLGGIGTGATLGWLPDIVATAGEAGKRYRRVVK